MAKEARPRLVSWSVDVETETDIHYGVAGGETSPARAAEAARLVARLLQSPEPDDSSE